jgi:tetratricopeptide (TPR) repeat protein
LSMIEHTATSTLGKIFIGRRILELMQEKGNAYSIRAFADRLGINRETFRTTLTGDRPISLSLVEKIAEGLHVTEERLRQLDTVKKEEELVSLLTANSRTKIMLMRASTIAKELVEVALGDTERGFAYNNLGRTQFLQQEYEDAHESWKKALVYARKIHKSFEDRRLLNLVSANFMMTCARLKDFGGADEMLQFVEGISSDDHQVLGVVAYSRMVMYGDRGNFERAKKYAYQSLEHFTKTNDTKQIGHGHINLARTEYLLGNYTASAEILASALEIVSDFDHILVRVVKDYVKSLLKLRDYDTAIQVVEKYETVTKRFPEYWNKLQIMYSVLRDDPQYADSVVNDLQSSVEVRTLACKCLFEYYAKRGDSESALRYYELERKYSRDNSEFVDEEGF